MSIQFWKMTLLLFPLLAEVENNFPCSGENLVLYIQKNLCFNKYYVLSVDAT